jgi:DNA polymerase
VTNIYLDFETRSTLPLPERGLDNYLRHPSTQPLMLAYAFDDQKTQLWERHIHGELPVDVRESLADPSVKKIAWNAGFERNVLKFIFGTWVPYDQWIDPMVHARHMSMPGYLEEVSEILGLTDEAKMTWGTKKDPGEAQTLIKMFCEPTVQGGEETLFGISEPWFRDWDTDPEMWTRFCEYCKRDVEAERAILRKMKKFPLPDVEQRGWCLDQKINDRGIPTDLELVNGSSSIATRVKEDLRAQLLEITKLENPNSQQQMLGWLKAQGYTFGALGKAFVARALAGECELTDAAKQALILRKQAAKTSDSKLDAIANMIGPDGRLRHQFAFMGASRTGRWSGHDVQPQNLPTPTPFVKKNLELACDLLRTEDYLSLTLEFPSLMDVVAGTIRSLFRASHGKTLAVCDLSAIENRIIGWLTGCDAITQVFRDKKDPYLDFAARLYGIPYEQLFAEYMAGDKTKRTNGKPATLGCGFGLGGGEEYETKDGDILKGGLWGYAWNMGVQLTHDEAHASVRIFRESYPEVVNFWYDLEDAVVRAIRTKEIQTIGPVEIQCFGAKLFRILLPSGRGLHYIRPKIEKMEVHGKMKDGITCEGKDQKTHKWGRIKTYGGKLTENIVQAIARDVLLNGMLLADERDLPIVLHVHDEIGCEVDKTYTSALDDLRDCMMTAPLWGKDLLLGAEGYCADVYRKD